MKKIISEQEISDIVGLHYTNISKKKKNDFRMYEALKLGSICKKFEISEEDLILMTENNNLEKFKRILNIIKEQ